jgi:hypothetical protein
VVRDPSAFGITVGLPCSVAAMTELVVPRSIPTLSPSLPPAVLSTERFAARQFSAVQTADLQHQRVRFVQSDAALSAGAAHSPT